MRTQGLKGTIAGLNASAAFVKRHPPVTALLKASVCSSLLRVAASSFAYLLPGVLPNTLHTLIYKCSTIVSWLACPGLLVALPAALAFRVDLLQGVDENTKLAIKVSGAVLLGQPVPLLGYLLGVDVDVLWSVNRICFLLLISTTIWLVLEKGGIAKKGTNLAIT